jgi:hypothetical protein
MITKPSYRLPMLAMLLVLGMVGTIAAQDVPHSVKAEIDRQQAYVGDRLRFTLTLIADSTTSVDSIPVGENLGDFDVIGRQYDLSGDGSGGIRHIVDFDLAVYKMGQFWIPQIPIRFIHADSTTSEFMTDSLAVIIMSVASGDSLVDIKGLKPQIYFGSRFPWLYVIVAAIVLAGLVVWMWRRRKKSEAVSEAEPIDTRPPWVIADEALRRLRESGLLANGEFKLFYLALTDILRAYIEPRFGVDALDRTTSELREELTQISLDDHYYDLLFGLFDSADLVKFAKLRPEMSEAESDFQKGWQFVQSTGEKRHVGVSGT